MTDGFDVANGNTNLPAQPAVDLTPPPLPPTDDPITDTPVVPQKEEVRPSFSAMPDSGFPATNPLDASVEVSTPMSQNFPEKVEPVVEALPSEPVAMPPLPIEPPSPPNVPIASEPIASEDRFVPPPMPPREENSGVNLGNSDTPPSPPKTGLGAKPFVIGGVLFFMAISAGIAFYFIQRGGLNIQKKAESGFCEGPNGTQGQECNNLNKCNVQGGCDPACCVSTSDCSISGQSCDIPNGNCNSGTSCNAQGSGFHKDCVGNLCVEVAGEGNDICTSNDACLAQPTQPATTPGVGACPWKKCPGGTKDCASNEQCKVAMYPSCTGDYQNVCITITGLQGCCTDGTDCASWEKCVSGNDACPGGTSCRSLAGCGKDSDCLPGQTCVNQTCTGGTGNVSCVADANGVKIENKTTSNYTGVTVEWFSKKCSDNGGTNCACTGSPTTETVDIAAGGTFSRGISGDGCAWQSDIKVKNGTGILAGCNNANAGCISGCGQPTTPPGVPVCASVEAYKVGTTPPSLVGLLPGDILRITVSASNTVDGAAVKIAKGTTEQQFNSIDGQGLWTTQGRVWQYDYTIPADGLGDWEISGFVKTGGVWK